MTSAYGYTAPRFARTVLVGALITFTTIPVVAVALASLSQIPYAGLQALVFALPVALVAAVPVGLMAFCVRHTHYLIRVNVRSFRVTRYGDRLQTRHT